MAMNPHWKWDMFPSIDSGLQIYDFHPIHVALNTADLSVYTGLKRSLGTRPLMEATRKDIEPFVNRGNGTRGFLEKLVRETPKNRWGRIYELAAQVPGGQL